MIYIIKDVENDVKLLVVKATDEKEISELIRLKDTEKIVGRLTDNEISVLNTSSFVVIQA